MPLSRELELGPGDIVLDGNPAPFSPKGAQPLIFSPCLLCANGRMDQFNMPLGTEVGLALGHFLLDGDPEAPPERGIVSQCSAHVCCGQADEWIMMLLSTEVRLGPGHIVLDGDPAPPEKRELSHNFGTSKRMNGS